LVLCAPHCLISGFEPGGEDSVAPAPLRPCAASSPRSFRFVNAVTSGTDEVPVPGAADDAATSGAVTAAAIGVSCGCAVAPGTDADVPGAPGPCEGTLGATT
jgi:hypothetical protein